MIVVRAYDHPVQRANSTMTANTHPYRAIILARRENLLSSGVFFLTIR